ncbi:unnamed protein product [Meganyctiphanes norvegica]|uniref:Uncharacterized protein n=1 Tax=Meganyctiphanes norvegica TaxID=48144 RepID=A0AAV2QY63_MEGNR
MNSVPEKKKVYLDICTLYFSSSFLAFFPKNTFTSFLNMVSTLVSLCTLYFSSSFLAFFPKNTFTLFLNMVSTLVSLISLSRSFQSLIVENTNVLGFILGT